MAIFTMDASIVQVYLNQEPIFSLQPEGVTSSLTTATVPIPTTSGNSRSSMVPSLVLSEQKQKEAQYLLQRFRHSLGEVSCLHLEEYVSLPPEATLSIRYYSAQLAQGFLSIQKI